MRNAVGKSLLWLTMLKISIHKLDIYCSSDFGKQSLLTLFMDILLLQILGATGFIECWIEVWEERRLKFWRDGVRYVLFLHMHIKSAMTNATGKLLLWLNRLNKSDMRIVNFWFSAKQPSVFVLLMIYNTKVYLLLKKNKIKGSLISNASWGTNFNGVFLRT
mgnify:CR=1 FL=1